MYRQQFEPSRGYAPEYIDHPGYQEDYDDDEMYENVDLGLSEATAIEMADWSETVQDLMEGMDDDELAEFAEELMDDEFLGSIIGAAVPLVKGLFRKKGKNRRPRYGNRGGAGGRPRRPHFGRPTHRPTAGRALSNFGRQASQHAGQFLQNLGGNIQQQGPQFFHGVGQRFDHLSHPYQQPPYGYPQPPYQPMPRPQFRHRR